jgi:hypothetical protein
MKRVLVITALLGLSLAAGAASNKTGSVQTIKDVETLNDDLNKYSGQRVQVSGEVEDKIDARSIVLESGGTFNDEIVVVAGPNLKGDLASLQEDTDVTVTGTIVLKPVADVRRDYRWDVTPDMLAEFRDVKAFLVADEITSVKR